MRTVRLFFLLLLLVGIIWGCQGAPTTKEPASDLAPKTEFQKIDPMELSPASVLAMAVFDLARQGILGTIPGVKVDPQGMHLENETGSGVFRRQNVLIIDAQETPDGTYSQTMVVESVDPLGRISLSRDYVAYRLREANVAEIADIKRSYLEKAQAQESLDEELRKEFREAVLAYQQAVGLEADGVLGPKTAESIVQDTSILDIQELSSHVLYPEEPRHVFYVLDCETVEKEPEVFYRGFESLAKVREHALTVDAFKGVAEPGKRFILFVYFFDRVDPNDPIHLGLSSVAKRKTEMTTPTYHAAPGRWPVLVETISVDQRLGSRLYVNLFIDKNYVSSLRLK